jgi:two-component system chemotaxis sensor kinase CheA
MSIDMSQFYQVFFDEAAEHLASMESLLLALDLDAPDADQLNAIFRAAHSIKGGSGTFGFTDMASVTHILETLLDRVRKHEITLTHDMVDAFLQAGDALRGLLTAHQNGSIADEAASIAICIKLEKLTEGSPELRVEHLIKSIPSSASAEALAASPVPASQLPTYQIQFTNSFSAFPTETHLNNLLTALSNVGMINHQLVSSDSVTLSLTTPKTDAQLREIFSFFLDMQHLSIIEVDGNPGKDEDPGYGFFATDASESEAEKEQGYGFFEAPAVIRSGIENAQGYGFFEAPETIQSGFENAQGYGFFTEVESRPYAPAHAMSARQDDVPGRRATDRAAVTPVGENSIRVGVGKVDNLVNLVGELVITTPC